MDTTPNNTIDFRADRLSEADWYALLASFDDANIWQSQAYGVARWDADGIEHARLYEGDTVRAAAQLALPKVPLFGRPVAYVRWGPVWRRDGKQLDTALCKRFLKALHAHYVVERKTVLWIRPRNARTDDLAAAFEETGFVPDTGQADHGTFILDLTSSDEEFHSRMNKSWRRNLKRAAKSDFTFEQVDAVRGAEIFMELFAEMASRKGFKIEDEIAIYNEIQADLPEAFRLHYWVCTLDGKPLAASAISALGDTAIGLLSVSSAAGRERRAAYALDWHCIHRFKDKGFVRWDVEGDEGGGLLDYKIGLVGKDGHVKFLGTYMSRERPALRALLSMAKRVKEKIG